MTTIEDMLEYSKKKIFDILPDLEKKTSAKDGTS